MSEQISTNHSDRLGKVNTDARLKQTYATPRLIVYGGMAKLTRGLRRGGKEPGGANHTRA
jgi:hypothetical protein